MICPTLKVEDKDGNEMIINESDFDSKSHVLFDSVKPAKVVKKQAKKSVK